MPVPALAVIWMGEPWKSVAMTLTGAPLAINWVTGAASALPRLTLPVAVNWAVVAEPLPGTRCTNRPSSS